MFLTLSNINCVEKKRKRSSFNRIDSVTGFLVKLKMKKEMAIVSS